MTPQVLKWKVREPVLLNGISIIVMYKLVHKVSKTFIQLSAILYCFSKHNFSYRSSGKSQQVFV